MVKGHPTIMLVRVAEGDVSNSRQKFLLPVLTAVPASRQPWTPICRITEQHWLEGTSKDHQVRTPVGKGSLDEII